MGTCLINIFSIFAMAKIYKIIHILILKMPITIAADNTFSFIFYFIFFYIFFMEISLDISCKSSAKQMIHKKCQDFFL